MKTTLKQQQRSDTTRSHKAHVWFGSFVPSTG